MNIFKKIKLFSEFKKTIKPLKSELEQTFNARIDKASRIYSVLNIPQESIEEPYNLRKTDIDKISENYIKEYSFHLSQFLDKNGLKELYKFYDIKKVDKYSYLVVVGFSLFKSTDYYNMILYKLLPAFVIIFLIILFLL